MKTKEEELKEKCILCDKPIIEKGFCDKHSTNKMLGLPITKSNDKPTKEEEHKQSEMWKEVMKEVLRETDLSRYPFDDFWFGVGFEKGKQQTLKDVLKIIDEWKKGVRNILINNSSAERSITVTDKYANIFELYYHSHNYNSYILDKLLVS